MPTEHERATLSQKPNGAPSTRFGEWIGTRAASATITHSCAHAPAPPQDARPLPQTPMADLDAASLSSLAEFANKLADAARAEILPYWRRKDVAIESKFEPGRSVAQIESPVTIADQNAEKAMRALIEKTYPSHGIYGEEFGAVRTDAAFCWVLDPIDGTKAFITGKPLFGTLIALCHHGRPIVGVIDQCVLKERWVGVEGKGTTLNGAPVTSTGVGALADAMLYATTPHMFADGFEANAFAAVRDAVKRPLYGGDCYAYALVASGFGADLVVEADLGLYDYAAVVPVIRGAGGVVTDWNGASLTIQNHEASKGRVVAAANATLHSAALAVLKRGGAANEAPAEVASERLLGATLLALGVAILLLAGGAFDEYFQPPPPTPEPATKLRIFGLQLPF